MDIISSGELYVSGENAVVGTEIFNTSYIYDIGYQTFNNSIISSNGLKSKKLLIESYGYYSTYNTKVLCYNGDTCVMGCFGDESCFGTKMYCETGSSCHTTCESCANCPTVINVNSIDQDVDIDVYIDNDIMDMDMDMDMDVFW